MAGARTPLLAASLGAALGLLVGAAVGLRLAPDGSDARALTPTGKSTATERDARVAALEAEVARWRGAYEELARKEGAPNAPPEPEPSAAPPPAPGPAAPPDGRPFDTQALQERGYTEEEANRLRERYEAYELALLYLNDRAGREGWRGQPRFQAESRQLADALHAELGDRDYDAILYGAGRSNRVQVAGVLAGSAGERAGLHDGDEIVSYDGHRIFEGQALVQATGIGEAGAQTEMVVRRDGQELRVVLPRGPIGIRLQPARVPPEGFL
jgi:membrane-associated protease RseP (regulator of RpoE activity)